MNRIWKYVFLLQIGVICMIMIFKSLCVLMHIKLIWKYEIMNLDTDGLPS